MSRWLKLLFAYLITAPIPALVIGALQVEYENLIFWLSLLYGLPFLAIAEVVGDYLVGGLVYWILVAALVAGLGWSRRRADRSSQSESPPNF